MRLPPLVHARVQTLLLMASPVFGIIFGGMLVAAAHTLVGPKGNDSLHPAVFAVLAASAVVVALFAVGAVRVRRGAHTYFPRLWRAVPWTMAGGFVLGVLVVGVRAWLGLLRP